MAGLSQRLGRKVKAPNICPNCGERVTMFAAGCAYCGADIPREWNSRKKGQPRAQKLSAKLARLTNPR